MRAIRVGRETRVGQARRADAAGQAPQQKPPSSRDANNLLIMEDIGIGFADDQL